jgi:hypothetical protein
MRYSVSTLSADQSIEIRLSQYIRQILAQQAFEVLVSGSQLALTSNDLFGGGY